MQIFFCIAFSLSYPLFISTLQALVQALLCTALCCQVAEAEAEWGWRDLSASSGWLQSMLLTWDDMTSLEFMKGVTSAGRRKLGKRKSAIGRLMRQLNSG